MFDKLNIYIIKWATDNNPWTNVYGLSRTIMAFSTALTLALNNAETIFKPAVGIDEYPVCSNIGAISIFCLTSNDYFWLNIMRWISILILLIVASGWRPRVTALFHWWISFSLQVSGLTLDGGEQVAAVFTLLLLPIALTDPRKSHWEKIKEPEKIKDKIYAKIMALVAFSIIRIQVALLYFSSTTAKLTDPEWIDGTAVYYYLQDPMLGLNPWLEKIFNPILSSWLIIFPTWGTLLVQILLIVALFAPRKRRKYILIIAICMHEVFALFLGLISFSLIMFSILLLYLRPYEDEFKFNFLNFLTRKKIENKLNEEKLKEVV